MSHQGKRNLSTYNTKQTSAPSVPKGYSFWRPWPISAAGKGAGQAPALVRCFPRLALVRWYAGTLNGRCDAATLNCAGTLKGRHDAGTLNCAGTLLRRMAGTTLVRWIALVRCYAEWPARRWYAELRWHAATLNGRPDAGTLVCCLLKEVCAFSREIGFQALIVKIIQPAAKAPASLGQAYSTAGEVCAEAVHCVIIHHGFAHVWSMYRSSPLRSTLNTNYITSLDMCEVCTEAVRCVALWTRITSRLWTCVKYVPKQSIA